jgi:aminomethyltransferase
MSELQRTSLYETHVAAKARLVPFAGWEMPVQYTGVLNEIKAVRESVGLFDVSHMGRVRVRGHGALDYLQHLVVSDVAKLPAEGGQGQYSLMCLEAGGVIDDIIIYRLGAEEFIVVVNASNRDKDLSWMRRHTMGYDVILEDESDRTALIAVQGPKAIELVSSLSDRDIAALPRFGLDETVIDDVQTMAARTGYTGEDGVELFCLAIDAPALWAALAEAGGIPCGLGARDTLRLEAALPLYGHEMNEHITPYEARLGWVVKTDKEADFLGKNVLTELKAAPKRKVLVGIEMEGRGIPRENYPILAPESANGSTEPIGIVTSGTFSPMRSKGIAMARVEAAYATKGTVLDVVIREARHSAHVVALPFYKNV